MGRVAVASSDPVSCAAAQGDGDSSADRRVPVWRRTVGRGQRMAIGCRDEGSVTDGYHRDVKRERCEVCVALRCGAFRWVGGVGIGRRRASGDGGRAALARLGGAPRSRKGGQTMRGDGRTTVVGKRVCRER